MWENIWFDNNNNKNTKHNIVKWIIDTINSQPASYTQEAKLQSHSHPTPIKLIQSSIGFSIYTKEITEKYFQNIWLYLLEIRKSTKKLCNDGSLFHHTVEKCIWLLFLRPHKESATLVKSNFSVSRELQSAGRGLRNSNKCKH